MYQSHLFTAKTPGKVDALVVVAKATFEFHNGRLSLAREPAPLSGEIREEPSERGLLVQLSDSDFWPFKPATDVVIQGHVHSPRHNPVSTLEAIVEVGTLRKSVRVFGDRQAEFRGGQIRFGYAEPFTSIPITYERAYGGLDASTPFPSEAEMAREVEGETNDEFIRRIREQLPTTYPRNPVGRGYIVHANAQALNGLPLPNFEDPANLLRPETLVLGQPQDWWRMPVPQGFGWFSVDWFPRSLFMSALPEFSPPQDDRLEEVRRGYLTPGFREAIENADLPDLFSWRVANAASPALIADLRGDEPVRLSGFSPGGELRFALPGSPPEILIAYRGAALVVRRRLHTLLIEPDAQRFSMLWAAHAAAPQELLEAMPQIEESQSAELPGVQAWVDRIPCKVSP